MEQALRLIAALGLGAALGLAYDLLRPWRRRAGRASPLFDVLFARLGGAAAFLYAFTARDARLGIWELAAMLGGFLLWLALSARCALWAKSWTHEKKEGFWIKIRQK